MGVTWANTPVTSAPGRWFGFWVSVTARSPAAGGSNVKLSPPSTSSNPTPVRKSSTSSRNTALSSVVRIVAR
jgi:hypothetical protein